MAPGGFTLLFVLAALSSRAAAATGLSQWQKPPPFPPPASLAWNASRPLKIDVVTFPAHGHYQLVKSIAIALAARGHNVSMVLCEQSHDAYASDGLPGLGIGLVSAGACAAFDARTPLLSALIEDGGVGALFAVLEGMAEVNRQMCEGALLEHYADPAARPDVLVFDGDTFCALDVSTAYRLPRVARLGTGPRNAYTNAVSVPSFGSALPGGRESMTLARRVTNAAIIALSRLVISPAVLPNVHARHRRSALETAAAALQARGLPVPSPPPRRHDPQGLALPPSSSAPPSLDAYLPSEVSYDPRVQWDGAPILYTTHWGLEYPRALEPNEHVVGFTTGAQGEGVGWGSPPASPPLRISLAHTRLPPPPTDFAAAAAEPLPAYVRCWLQARERPLPSAYPPSSLRLHPSSSPPSSLSPPPTGRP